MEIFNQTTRWYVPAFRLLHHIDNELDGQITHGQLWDYAHKHCQRPTYAAHLLFLLEELWCVTEVKSSKDVAIGWHISPTGHAALTIMASDEDAFFRAVEEIGPSNALEKLGEERTKKPIGIGGKGEQGK